jgi:hypothetical protein
MKFLDVTLSEREEPKEEVIEKKLQYNWMYENSINNGKQFYNLDNIQEFKYNQWRTNSSLSNFPDTIMDANIMNMVYHLSDKLHYHYLYLSVRKKNRYGKKKTDEDKKLEKQLLAEMEEIRLIQDYYKYNIAKAKTARKILSKDQLNFIKNNKKKAE